MIAGPSTSILFRCSDPRPCRCTLGPCRRYIWGRGALDVKVTVLQQLEAVAALLRQGYAPQRTILLAFGHDEEVGGGSGALLWPWLREMCGCGTRRIHDPLSPTVGTGPPCAVGCVQARVPWRRCWPRGVWSWSWCWMR